jgi:Uncharacterised nucleotidyltransferase
MSAVSSQHSLANPWPDFHQLLLLRACVEHGEPGREAWEEWAATVDFEKLDAESTYLLPMLDHNLRLIGVTSHPWLGRIKGYHRYIWTRNRRLFAQAAQLIGKLRPLVGDDLLVIKGAALACSYYPGSGMRPMGDFDIMIKREAAPAALKFLRRSGWKMVFWNRPDFPPEHYFFYRHSENLYREGGGDVDVHWHLMEDLCGTASSQPFWDEALPLHLPDGTEARTFQLTDLLFHACLQSLHWKPVPATRWIVDALLLLQCGKPVDWRRLTDLADTFQYSLLLGSALQYLASNFPRQANIPNSVIGQLLDREHPKGEIAEHKGRLQGEHYPPNALTYYRWFRLRSLPRKLGWFQEIRSMAQFFASRWSLPNLWLILILGPLRFSKRLFRRDSLDPE